MKLTRNLIAACSLLSLSSVGSQPAQAFPFFHRKPAAEEQPATTETQPAPPQSVPAGTSTAPAFRPYTPTYSPYSAIPPQPSKQLRQPSNPPVATPATQIEKLRPIPNEQPPSAPTLLPTDLQPQSVLHSPPQPPERPPIPPPPAVQAPIMVSSGAPTPPLSWRAVAYKLWISPESLPPKRSKSQSSFPFPTALTMKALMKALSEAGWNTTQFSASAGHLLAAKADAETCRIRLIFAAHPGDSGNTVVRAATEPDSKSFDKTQIESIFSRAQDIAARNELL